MSENLTMKLLSGVIMDNQSLCAVIYTNSFVVEHLRCVVTLSCDENLLIFSNSCFAASRSLFAPVLQQKTGVFCLFYSGAIALRRISLSPTHLFIKNVDKRAFATPVSGRRS